MDVYSQILHRMFYLYFAERIIFRHFFIYFIISQMCSTTLFPQTLVQNLSGPVVYHLFQIGVFGNKSPKKLFQLSFQLFQYFIEINLRKSYYPKECQDFNGKLISNSCSKKRNTYIYVSIFVLFHYIKENSQLSLSD